MGNGNHKIAAYNPDCISTIVVVVNVNATIKTLKPRDAAQCTPIGTPHFAQWQCENSISDKGIDLAAQFGHSRVMVNAA
jgi:hypothetical protein